MLGILIILLVSWLLLYAVDKEHLGPLGFLPVPKRLGQFVIGIVVIFCLRAVLTGLETWLTEVSWSRNSTTTPELVLSGTLYHLRSALTEELIFRGAVLYLLIKWLGKRWAILISSMTFGVYHIFSYGMLGAGLVPTLYVILLTGLMGGVWAYGYWKTGSVMLPFGLHFGWNFFTALFYHGSPYDSLWWVMTEQNELTSGQSTVLTLIINFTPVLLTYLFIRYFVSEERTDLRPE